MSGVEGRTRLDQLRALWRRTYLDIQSAFREGDTFRLGRLQHLEERLNEAIVVAGGQSLRPGARQPVVRGVPRGQRQKSEDRVAKHLERLGVTSHDVKVWAVAQGLLPAVRRGRVKGQWVAAYEAAHTNDCQNGAA